VSKSNSSGSGTVEFGGVLLPSRFEIDGLKQLLAVENSIGLKGCGYFVINRF